MDADGGGVELPKTDAVLQKTLREIWAVYLFILKERFRHK